MTTSPGPPTDVAGAVDGHVAVDGTGVTLSWETPPGLLDVVLTGALDDSSVPVVSCVAQAIDALRDQTGREGVRIVADHLPGHPWPLPGAVATALGLGTDRDLWQLRRPLPVPGDHPRRQGTPPLAPRPFDPDLDAEAWVRVNNRAFATHPDQGNQTVDQLVETLGEDWIDLDGFLVVDDDARPGELAGFCWTRVHPATDDDPVLGEIYVIGVDPSRHGAGEGGALVLAGLDHLSELGIGVGMLYVEADNAPALRLYGRLGFEPHRRRRITSR